MALGGYIFRGYKCEKGALSDTDWALLIHKTRIKAFIEAATASGSSWAFSKTSGDTPFETYGNVIYNIDNSGYNFISFFKYGNEERYFAIISMFNQTELFNNDARSARTSYNIWGEARTCFHVASMDDFASVDFMLDTKTYPTHALSMYPVTTCFITWGSGLATPSTSNTLFTESSLYFGYAIKGKEITCFTSTETWKPSGSNAYIYKQCFGFDSMSLSSPNDTYNIFAVSLDYGSGNESDSANQNGANELTGYQCDLTLMDTGRRFNLYNVNYAGLFINWYVFKATFSSLPSVLPYEAAILASENSSSRSGYPLNADGIASKGSMNVEFVAVNGTADYFNNLFARNTPQSQGKYLAANYTNTSGTPESVCYYVGWDSSNPNILTDAAWTSYSGT